MNKPIEFTNANGDIYRVVRPAKTWAIAVWNSAMTAWVSEGRGTYATRQAAIDAAREMAA